MLMVIPTDIASLIDFFSFAAWLFYGMAVFCVILLRFTKKKAERKIKVYVYEKHKANKNGHTRREVSFCHSTIFTFSKQDFNDSLDFCNRS